jgi:transglutaminase-like putative cysteine protease
MSSRSRVALAAAGAAALGAIALTPLYNDQVWLLPAWLSVAAVFATSIGARRLGVPEPMIPYACLAAAALVVVMAYGDHKAGGLIPTLSTLHSVGDKYNRAFELVKETSPPVTTTSELALLAVTGVAAVAVAIEAVAVTARRPALAGLPMLALFAVPAALVPAGLGWAPFTFAAAGYVLLLVAEGKERVARWGRPFHAERADEEWRSDSPFGSPVTVLGRRLGATAVCVALVVPVFLPDLSYHGLAKLFDGAGLGGDNSGGSRSATVVNPVAALTGKLNQTNDTELLQVHTDDPDPGYLRLTTLDEYDAKAWKQGKLSAPEDNRVTHGLPEVKSGVVRKTKTVKGTVTATGLSQEPYLPLYPEVEKVGTPKGQDWRFEQISGTVFSSRNRTGGMTYSFTSKVREPTANELQKAPPLDPSDPTQRMYGSPPHLSQEVQSVLAGIIAGKQTQFEKVQAILQYFQSPDFKYVLRPPKGPTSDDLTNFLRNKQGFCQQYSAAMATLVREAGIPARVAIGFTKGHRKGNYWSITAHNAHAWTEVYFSGIGWTLWEPTPLDESQDEGGTATSPAYQDAAVGPIGQPTNPGLPSASATADPGAFGNKPQPGFDDSGGRGATLVLGGGKPAFKLFGAGEPDFSLLGYVLVGIPTVLVLLLGLAALCVIVPTVTRVAAARRRLRYAGLVPARAAGPPGRGAAGAGAGGPAAVGLDVLDSGHLARAAHAAWDELLATAYDVGLTLDSAQSPRATAERLVEKAMLVTSAADGVRAVARAEERACYAAAPVAEPGLGDAVRTAKAGLYRWAPFGRRTRARFLPPSTLLSFREAVRAFTRRATGGLYGARHLRSRVTTTARKARPAATS